MSFQWPNMLWVLLLLPVLVGIYLLLQRRRKKYALRYASLSLVKEALGRGPGMRRHIPPIIFLAAVATMIVAVARPMGNVTTPSWQGTIILTIDVSGSMRADDLKPNRLEAAKEAAKAFVEKQPSNVRIGVVSFSDSASIVQPPTKDREAITAAISRLSMQRRTAIGSAIITSLDAIFEEDNPHPTTSTSPWRGNLAPSPTPTPTFKPVPPGSNTQSVIVLLSDGVSNTGPRPLEAVQQAQDRGVRVYTVGVGSPSGAVLRMEGFSMRVQLDEETLKAIAERTTGTYFKAENSDALTEIYDKLSSNLVFKDEKTELTAWFTGGAVLFLLVAGFLSLLWLNRLP